VNPIESINSFALKQYSSMVMPTKVEPQGRILIYANMGYGDLVFYLPVLRAIEKKFETVIILEDQVKTNFLRGMGIESSIIKAASLSPAGTCQKFDTVVCHWLQQWTPIIRQIIKMRIPCRIGHHWRDKYNWLWTHPTSYWKNGHYRFSNESLLEPFGLEPVYDTVKIKNPITDHEIIIVPNSSEPKRDWPGFNKLYDKLSNLYRVFQLQKSVPMDVAIRMLAGARLVIGNNSGMPIIADFLKVAAIQIFRQGEKVTPQIAGLLHGIDFIEPTVDEVYSRVNSILS
jgi:ADP-heptose:LPS heptosyltransferase